MFDAQAFMNTQFNDANATRTIPCPAGEYNAQIEKIDSRVLEKTGQVILAVTWNIDSQQVKETTGRDKVTVRQDIWLDFSAPGVLAFGEGKNVGLGRLRAAVNQNQKGQPWTPSQLVGQVAKVKVTHRANADTGDIYDQVSAVSSLSG